MNLLFSSKLTIYLTICLINYLIIYSDWNSKIMSMGQRKMSLPPEQRINPKRKEALKCAIINWCKKENDRIKGYADYQLTGLLQTLQIYIHDKSLLWFSFYKSEFCIEGHTRSEVLSWSSPKFIAFFSRIYSQSVVRYWWKLQQNVDFWPDN